MKTSELTFKTPEITWRQYITDSLEKVDHTERSAAFTALNDKISPYLSIRSGNLKDKNVSKIIVKERTNKYVEKKFGVKFAFRFQCVVTGRISQLIKEADYPSLFILPSDKQDGGKWPDVRNLANQTDKLFKTYLEESAKIHAKYPVAFLSHYKERYHEYLNSPEWKAKRQAILKRDGNKCVISGCTTNLNVHHITYDNIGDEPDYDLLTVSNEVHQIIHDETHELSKQYNDTCTAHWLANQNMTRE